MSEILRLLSNSSGRNFFILIDRLLSRRLTTIDDRGCLLDLLLRTWKKKETSDKNVGGEISKQREGKEESARLRAEGRARNS